MTGTTHYRAALVTGASSGIGRALALRAARSGARVVLCARRRGLLVELADEIAAEGGEARVLPLDVSRSQDTFEAIRDLDRERGGLDLVIACAGVGAPPGAPAHSWEAVREALHTNLCGAAATLTAALPGMIERGRGHLVAISSLASFGALPRAAAYCAPKAGLSMLCECLRLDLRGTGVAVTAVHAGFVRTAMVAGSRHPLPQLMEVDALAERVWSRLPGRPARIDLPQPLALGTRLFARLPARLRALALTRLRD